MRSRKKVVDGPDKPGHDDRYGDVFALLRVRGGTLRGVLPIVAPDGPCRLFAARTIPLGG
jgi:hypothetical protein